MRQVPRMLSPLRRDTDTLPPGAIRLSAPSCKVVLTRGLIPKFSGHSSFYSVLLGESDYEADLIWGRCLKRERMGLRRTKYATGV